MKKIRCAIYTRKSSEEGLEQEFNSLHAQREACSAYVMSQKHEGWELLPEEYDDGGFSGGNMDRPALKRLLADIEQGKIDIIVVYKVDRLTRSLMDFARLVETMDKKGVSFVSITQQFNTTTSMGRLTLNVLLSFAQFEREVTGERIRDKIALSKQRGKWMGGMTPIGYEAVKQKLVINEEDANIIRHIFDRYLALKSVNLLKAELDAEGYRTKERLYDNGKVSGNKKFFKGHLYRLLQNHIYIGEIEHKGKCYPGQHEGIIDRETFDKVQKLIASNRVKKISGIGHKTPCLLAGRIFDDRGNYMSPKHSNGSKRHYRYYASQAIIQGYPHQAGSLPNIPANEIEKVVCAEIARLLKNEKRLHAYIKEESVEEQKSLIAKAKALDWEDHIHTRLFVRSVLIRVDLSDKSVGIQICGKQLIQALRGTLNAKPDDEPKPIKITADIKLAPTQNGSKIVIGSVTPGRNMQLVKAIARSFLWNEQFITGEKKTIKQIGDDNNISAISYISRVMRLRFLAPDIIESILEGTQPIEWTVEKLFTVQTFDWQEQRKVLGLIR